MGETDKKWFYTKEMHSDITDLGRACHVLKRLENRWDSWKEAIADTIILLLEINITLKSEGHKGYVPKVVKEEVANTTSNAFDKALEIEKEVDAKIKAEELAEELETKRLIKEAKAKEDKIAKLKADLKELDVESD